MSNLRQIALVLGMHRSGTSALAALISRLGFDLGKNLLPPNEFNARGYYENEKLVQFHDEILEHLGSSWHDLRFLPEGAFQGGWMDDAAQKLAGILQEEFGDAGRIVIKDPRATRLVPIWQRLAQERDLDLRFVLIGRHPLQVSYSLTQRDAFSRQKSLLLWLQYNLIAEQASRSGQRLILRYQELMARPEEKARALASFLGVESSNQFEEAAAAIDSSSAHHLAETETFCEQPDVQRWTASVWQILFRQTRITEARQKNLDRVTEQIRTRLSILPREANGQGDYEAAYLKRLAGRKEEELTSFKERLVEKNEVIQAAIRQRDELRKKTEVAAAAASLKDQEIAFLKERHQERTLTLQGVMMHRDEARKQAESGRVAIAAKEKEFKSLQTRLGKQAEIIARKDQEYKSLQTKAGTEAETARDRIEMNEGSLRSFEEERDFSEKVLNAASARIVEREFEWDELHDKLETLRRDWAALPLRRRLKELAGQSFERPPLCVRLNAITPTVWNESVANFRFGIAVFPDSNRPANFLIEGWVLPENSEAILPPLRLVNEAGERRGGAKRRRQRIDISLLFETDERAIESGFAFLNLEGFEKCRLEARRSPSAWVPLALIDLKGIGWQHISGIHEITKSRLFDHGWYARRYDLTALSRLSLISHYLREGASRGLWPNPLFDTPYYFESNREICTTGENPLLAYLKAAKEGKPRQPNRWFEPLWYLAKNNDVAKTGLDPLAHYLKFGKREKRNPGPDFDVAAYLKRNPDVERSRLDPLSHFIHYGSQEGRSFPRREDSINWIHEIEPREGRMNLLLVGHVLGDKMFGSERSLLELIQLIDRDRFNIYCSFPQSETSFFERIKPYVTGVAVFPYRWWSGASTDNDGYDCDFEEIMRSRRIGLVHVNSIVLRDPLVAARRLRIPSVLHLREIITRDPDLAARIGLPAEVIAAQVTARSEFVIANSHFTLAQYCSPKHSFVLYNSADEVALDIPLRERQGTLRVGMLSSNLPKKGLEGFFTLARSALEQGSPIEFWLIGPETEWVKQHFEENGGCPSNVHCAGYLARPRDALSQVDIVINLSTFAESFGRSVGEAMLARRPAVVYEYGALPELIRDGVDGFVVPFRDVDAVLERLSRFAQEPVLVEQMGEAARARAMGMFARGVGAQALGQIYDSIVSRSASRKVTGNESGLQPQSVAVAQAKSALRIGYFLWHFPVPSETFVLNELRCLVRDGHDVRVFCRQSPHKEFRPDFMIRWEHVDSVDDLAEKLTLTDRQVVHSHFVFPTVTNFLWPACEAAKIPFTFIAHAQDIFRHVNVEQNRLGEIAKSHWCKAVFAPGTFHERLFIEQGVPPEKIVINPQSVPVDFFRMREYGARRASRTVCAIHRFVEKKGLQHAIEAAAKLAAYDISLYLYGYGPSEEPLRAMAAALQLKNVHFCGPLNERADVVNALCQHDLFLCPSLRAADGDMDGIPTVLMEAMSCGTPVVASRISSLPDLVQDGVTGYLCEPGDTESLADAILRFYHDPTAKVDSIVRRARVMVETRYDIEKATRTLERIWSGEGLDVVLVTHNNLPELREVVGRLFRYTTRPFQLCVVDNNSDEDTRTFLGEMAEQNANVRLVLLDENVFVGPGTNKGIRLGTSDTIVYLCSKEGFVLSRGWDQQVMDYMETHPKVGLAGTLAHSPSYLTGRGYLEGLTLFPKFRNRDFAEENPQRIFAHVQGGVMVIRRGMFDEIGGFSEDVPHQHTDVEYSYYAESCGWELGNINGVAAYYVKTLPPLTAHLTEGIDVIHPGSLELRPLLDKVSGRETEFCNVCAEPVSFRRTANGLVCPLCASTSFHRTLYRHISESILPYRRLPALYISTFSGLSSLWEKMFQGRCLGYDDVLKEIEEDGKIDLADNGRDLIVLQVPSPVPSPNRRLLQEVRRILRPAGTLIYSQAYGVSSILSDETEFPRTSDEVEEFLKSSGFAVQSRINFASVVVRYLDCDLFQCRKLSTSVVHS